MGATGPTGPPGQIVYTDGGAIDTNWVTFAGFTSATFMGNLGGVPGATAKCQAQYASSFFCTSSDYARAEPDTSNAPPASGAWIDYDRDAIGNRSGSPCYSTGSWTLATTGDLGGYLNVTGAVSSSYCNVARPLACCRAATKKVFRGFTAATFLGDLGGVLGANAKCRADYPGSYFCTSSDYALAETTSVPSAVGAWIDYDRDTLGNRSGSPCYSTGSWTLATTGDLGGYLNATGAVSSSYCNVARPLACCSN